MSPLPLKVPKSNSTDYMIPTSFVCMLVVHGPEVDDLVGVLSHPELMKNSELS